MRGAFEVKWYDPRFGGELQDGSVRTVEGGGIRNLGQAPAERTKDWAVLVRRVWQAPASPPSASGFLVKLGEPVASGEGHQGDKMTAVVISPERYLGAKLEGTVAEARGTRLRLEFNSLVFRSKTIPIRTEMTGLVNSKGARDIHESGRPVRLAAGALVSSAPFALDEDSEIRLQVQELAP